MIVPTQQLPPGWEWARIADLCEINPKHSNEHADTLPVSFVPMAAVDEQNGQITGAIERPYGEVRKGYTHFAEGDVLWAKITPCMENGKAAVARGLTNGLGCGTTEFFVLRSRGAVLPEYLHRFVRQESYRTAARGTMQSGVGQARVPKEFIENTVLPVPPLAEQHRIVAKLDELFASSRAAETALDAVSGLAAAHEKSLLAAGYNGRLTADVRAWNTNDADDDLKVASQTRDTIWSTLLQDKTRIRRGSSSRGARKCAPAVLPDLSHGTPDLPPGWTIASVGQLALCLDSFRVPVKREERGKSGGYRYFGANGLVGEIDDYIFDLELVLVTEDETFYGRTKPIAYRVNGKCWVNNHAHVLLPLPPFTAEFLHYALMHYHVEPWLSGTTGRAKLTQADLLKLPIFVPPAEERDELCRRIRFGLEVSSRMGEQATDMSVHITALEAACVAKAMRGELVSQDMADEPASVLLERLRTMRIMPPAGRRTRRLGVGA